MITNNLPFGTTKDEGRFRIALPALVALSFLFFLNFISRVIFSPLLPTIEKDMAISHSVSGSFFLLISVGYLLSILSSGFVAARINHKRTIVASTIGSGVVLLFLGWASSSLTIFIALFLLGLAAGLYLPSGLSSIAKLLPSEYLARGMAVHELAPNLSFVAAPALSSFMLRWFSWQQGLSGLGLILIIAGIYYAWRVDTSEDLGIPPNLKILRCILSQRQFWIMAALFSLAISSTLGIYAMLPLFLVEEQLMTVGQANRLISISRIASLCMPIVAGWVGDRYGYKLVMGVVLVLSGSFTMGFGLVSGTALFVVIILQAMIAVCFFPSGFAVLNGLGPKGSGNVAVSLCIPLSFIVGGGGVPLLIGVLGDNLSFAVSYVFLGVIMLAGGLLYYFFQLKANHPLE